jgi:hypothetical protein
MKYEIRTTQVTVLPTTESIFSEMATTVTIVDEAAGEFVEVSQSGTADYGKIAIDSGEWPTLRDAINDLIAKCRESK